MNGHPEFENALPPLASPFAVSLTAPKHGWIDLHLRAEQIVYDISLSFVFDPFDAIRQFLEQIALGSCAELLILDEGHKHYLRAGKTNDDGRFRLGIWNTLPIAPISGKDHDLKIALDVMADRDAFAGSFYRAIAEIWALPDERTFRRAWLNYAEDKDSFEDAGALERSLPNVRSAVLDRFLAE